MVRKTIDQPEDLSLSIMTALHLPTRVYTTIISKNKIKIMSKRKEI
jgi:hypothetical protein